MVTIGERIAGRRAQAGWTQGELAQRAGVSPGTIRQIEADGVRNPGVVTLSGIARALGLRFEYVRTGQQPMLDTAGEAHDRL